MKQSLIHGISSLNQMIKKLVAVLLFSTLLSGFAEVAKASQEENQLNIRFAPLSLLIGWINVDLDVRIADEWTIGPTLGIWRVDVPDTYFVGDRYQLKRDALGVRANWSQNGVYKTGFYASPILQMVRAEVSGLSKGSNTNLSASASGITVTGIAGYHWFWDTINIAVGGGFILGAQASDVSVQEGNTSYKVANSGRGTGFALDFMLGWTF